MTFRARDTSRLPLIRPPDFVGREPQLAALTDALSRPPAVVLIEGEAGIGKSRLLREFLATAGQRSLVACCPPFREPYTLGPVVDALRQARASVHGLELSPLAGALRPLFPEWAPDLPPAPEPAEDATASRHRLFAALLELLAQLQIAVLAVEDLHWADDATLDFLLFLGSRRPQPFSLVVSYRREDVVPGSALLRISSRSQAGVAPLRLVLDPLDVAETEKLVSSMLSGATVSRPFAQLLHDHTESVPLAVEESLRLMHQRADLLWRDGGWVRRPSSNKSRAPTRSCTGTAQRGRRSRCPVRKNSGCATSTPPSTAPARATYWPLAPSHPCSPPSPRSRSRG